MPGDTWCDVRCDTLRTSCHNHTKKCEVLIFVVVVVADTAIKESNIQRAPAYTFGGRQVLTSLFLYMFTCKNEY